MKTQRIFALFILCLAMLFMSVGCQTISPAQRADESKLTETIARYTEPDGTEGIAHYYKKRYMGRKTSSGAIYNPKKLTAAHPTLPLGTRVKVVNLANNKSVIVTVNDRCREHEEAFIDLSREAARQMGMMRQGKANVRMTLAGQDNPSDKVQDTEQK
jgi:rare lipoprotein A